MIMELWHKTFWVGIAFTPIILLNLIFFARRYNRHHPAFSQYSAMATVICMVITIGFTYLAPPLLEGLSIKQTIPLPVRGQGYYDLLTLELLSQTDIVDMMTVASPLDHLQLLNNGACVLWVVGVIALSVLFVVGNMQFFYQVRRVSYPANLFIVGIAQKLSEQLTIGKKYRVEVCRLTPTPMQIGVFSPSIILPNEEYEKDSLELVLLHELVHLKKRHNLIKAVMIIFTIWFWYNPLVWFWTKRIALSFELVCDLAVTQNMNQISKIQYGQVLIDAVKPMTAKSFALVSYIKSSHQFKNLKERLVVVMEGTKKLGIAARTAIVMALVMITLLVLLLTAFTSLPVTETIANPTTEAASPNLSEEPEPLEQPKPPEQPDEPKKKPVNVLGYITGLPQEVEAPAETFPAPMPNYRAVRMRIGEWPDGQIFRYGVQYVASEGTPVQSVCAGEVIDVISNTREAQKSRGYLVSYGRQVAVAYTDNIVVRYSFVQEISVEIGDIVEVGTPLAMVSEYFSADGVPLCEIQILVNGEMVDPQPFFGLQLE